MNVFMKPGFTTLGLIAVLTGVAMPYAPDSVKLSCRRGCAFEHQVIMLFGQHTGVSLLGLGIIVIGVYTMWHTLRDGR